MRMPARGDIVAMSLDPVKGRETAGTRPVIVLSADEFNRASGLLLIAPISQGASASRARGFAVSLSGMGLRTNGVVQCDQVRTIDAVERRFRKLESAPAEIVDEVLSAVRAILD